MLKIILITFFNMLVALRAATLEELVDPSRVILIEHGELSFDDLFINFI